MKDAPEGTAVLDETLATRRKELKQAMAVTGTRARGGNDILYTVELLLSVTKVIAEVQQFFQPRWSTKTATSWQCSICTLLNKGVPSCQLAAPVTRTELPL